MKLFAVSSSLLLAVAAFSASAEAFFEDAVHNRELRGGRGSGGGRGPGGGRGSRGGRGDRTFSDFECAPDEEVVPCAIKTRRGEDPVMGSVACFETTRNDETVLRNACVGDQVPNQRDGTPPTVACGCCEGPCADVIAVCATPCPDDGTEGMFLVTNGTTEKCVTQERAASLQIKTRGADWECA